MSAPLVAHVGIFSRTRWQSPEGDRLIAWLEDGTVVLGAAEDGELIPGLAYQFYGRWEEHAEYGRQFHFRQFVRQEPHSRQGVVAYLTRYAPGVGPAVAARLWDAFGSQAVKVLRTQPETAAEAVRPFLRSDRAQAAAEALNKMADVEDTKIELTNLFAGRGFPSVLANECIDHWGILAPARIKRDPFCLLVTEFPGCGFARCDRLYIDLGLPPDRIKRQVIALWHAMHSDTSGHTWIDVEFALSRLGQLISGAKVRPQKAVKMACRAGWLKSRKDDAGKLWLAEADRAQAESRVAEKLLELTAWQPPADGSSLTVAAISHEEPA